MVNINICRFTGFVRGNEKDMSISVSGKTFQKLTETLIEIRGP